MKKPAYLKGDFMNFEIDKSLFLSSIQKVQAVVDRRNTVPILSNVRIKVDSGQMEVIATDLEVGLRDLVAFMVREYPKLVGSLMRDASLRKASGIDSQLNKLGKEYMGYILIVGQKPE